MHIGEIALHKPFCVDQDTTILGVSRLMRNFRVAELVVTHQPRGAFVAVGLVSASGIVTRIIAAGLDPGVMTAGDIAWPEANVARGSDDVAQKLRQLHADRNNVLPIVDGDGGIRGAVSVDELLRALPER